MKLQDSRENKSNCFPRDHTLSVYCCFVTADHGSSRFKEGVGDRVFWSCSAWFFGREPDVQSTMRRTILVLGRPKQLLGFFTSERGVILVNIELFSSHSQISPSELHTFTNNFFGMIWCEACILQSFFLWVYRIFSIKRPRRLFKTWPQGPSVYLKPSFNRGPAFINEVKFSLLLGWCIISHSLRSVRSLSRRDDFSLGPDLT